MVRQLDIAHIAFSGMLLDPLHFHVHCLFRWDGWCCCEQVRELHVYGSVVPVHSRDPSKFQHQVRPSMAHFVMLLSRCRAPLERFPSWDLCVSVWMRRLVGVCT